MARASLENDPHYIRGYWRGVRRASVELALWIAAAAVVMVLVSILCGSAYATTPCNQFFAAKQYAYVAPVYAAPVVQYYAGQDIQAEALAEKVARLVDKKLELRLASRQQQVAAKPQSMLAQHCAKCHSGATPKASLTYDGLTAIPPELVVAALRAIKDESMPKDHKIDPGVKGALMEELLSLDSTPVQPVRQQQPLQPDITPLPADRPPPAPRGDLQ